MICSNKEILTSQTITFCIYLAHALSNNPFKFFIDIDKAEHIGSMFTFRAVLPNRDHDDARPTLINREDSDNRIFTLFSGKIGTCVDAAIGVLNKIKGDISDKIK